MVKISVLDATFYVDAAEKLVKSTTYKKSWMTILSNVENEIPVEDYEECYEVLSNNDIVSGVV